MTNYGNPNNQETQYAQERQIFPADKNPFTSSEAIETQTERLCCYF